MPLFPNSVVTPMEAYNPDHWRKRSEMTRDKAACISNPSERSHLLKIAGEYERLAFYAEQVRASSSEVAPIERKDRVIITSDEVSTHISTCIHRV